MKNRACKPGRPPSPDLPPVPGKHPEVGRDYEYKRLGTASILAGLDLHDGHGTARGERRHRSREFVGLPQDRAGYYPLRVTIRLLLDNPSAHIRKETMACLATRPNRLAYVHTPKHGSWLNLVEPLFGKMARTFLRGRRGRTGRNSRRASCAASPRTRSLPSCIAGAISLHLKPIHECSPFIKTM